MPYVNKEDLYKAQKEYRTRKKQETAESLKENNAIKQLLNSAPSPIESPGPDWTEQQIADWKLKFDSFLESYKKWDNQVKEILTNSKKDEKGAS